MSLCPRAQTDRLEPVQKSAIHITFFSGYAVLGYACCLQQIWLLLPVIANKCFKKFSGHFLDYFLLNNINTCTWLPVEKSQSKWQRTEINGVSKSMVWPTLGWRTAREQNRLLACIHASNLVSILTYLLTYLSPPAKTKRTLDYFKA